MTTTSASTIIGGPAILTYNGATIYTEEDINVTVTRSVKERNVQGFGRVDDTQLDVITEITCKPAQWKNLTVLFPYFTMAIGTRIFGDVDKPLVIQSMTEGLKYTYARAAITTQPTIGAGVEKDLLGSMTFTALKGDTNELSTANAIVAIDTDSAFADTSFDPAYLFDLPYSVNWGADPYDAMDTEDGIDITPEATFSDVLTDAGGLIDRRLTNSACMASFIPVGLTHAQLLTLQKIQGTAARGAKLGSSLGTDLVISAGSGKPQITLYKAYPESSVNRFGVEPHGAGTVSARATRSFTAGAVNAVAQITTAA